MCLINILKSLVKNASKIMIFFYFAINMQILALQKLRVYIQYLLNIFIWKGNSKWINISLISPW